MCHELKKGEAAQRTAQGCFQSASWSLSVRQSTQKLVQQINRIVTTTQMQQNAGKWYHCMGRSADSEIQTHIESCLVALYLYDYHINRTGDRTFCRKSEGPEHLTSSGRSRESLPSGVTNREISLCRMFFFFHVFFHLFSVAPPKITKDRVSSKESPRFNLGPEECSQPSCMVALFVWSRW